MDAERESRLWAIVFGIGVAALVVAVAAMVTGCNHKSTGYWPRVTRASDEPEQKLVRVAPRPTTADKSRYEPHRRRDRAADDVTAERCRAALRDGLQGEIAMYCRRRNRQHRPDAKP